MSTPPKTITYLAEADVARLQINPAALRDHLTNVLRVHAQGQTLTRPKQTLSVKTGHFFQAMCAATHAPAYAGLKWVGINGANPKAGLPAVTGLVLLSDLETGLPVAIMDARFLTVMRTSALSAIAAQYLARPNSTSVGFVGCGEQALGHVDALRAVLPKLTDTVWFSPSRESRETAASIARGRGLSAHAAETSDTALDCDVVVTTVPNAPGFEPFLDARKLRPGTFVSAVDLGRSWLPEHFARFDRVYTDDLVQSADRENRAKLAYDGGFEADLSMLVDGSGAARRTTEERLMFLFPGIPLADLAAAQFIHMEAQRQGVGIPLPR